MVISFNKWFNDI